MTDTENGSTGPQSVPQSQGDTEPTYTLTGLSESEIEALWWMLDAANGASQHVQTLRSKLDALYLAAGKEDPQTVMLRELSN